MNDNEKTGGPAFPSGLQEVEPDTVDSLHKGMTLRDYFAAKASEEDINEHIWKGFVEDYTIVSSDGMTHIRKRQAMWTREQAKYRYADAMLKARGGEV